MKKKFLQDKMSGDKAENLIVALFEKHGWKTEKNTSKKKEQLVKYDVKISLDNYFLFFEVKNDIMSAKTHNLAIEYFNPKQNKESGILITTADFWLYVINNNEIWMSSVQEIKNHLKTVVPKRIVDIAGDNNASLFLYSKDSIMGFVGSLFIRIDGLPKDELEGIFKIYLDSKLNCNNLENSQEDFEE